MKKIIERLQFAKYPKDAVVFEQGDETNKDFFIIIKGSVEVWVKDHDKHKGRMRSIQVLPPAASFQLHSKALLLEVIHDDAKGERNDKTSVHEFGGESLSRSSMRSIPDYDLHNIKMNDCLKSRGELVPDLPKTSAKILVRKKSENFGQNLSPSECFSKPELMKKDSLMLYPTPKTEPEQKSLRAIVISEGETTKSKNTGIKYGPQQGLNLDSPSIDPNVGKVNSILKLNGQFLDASIEKAPIKFQDLKKYFKEATEGRLNTINEMDAIFAPISLIERQEKYGEKVRVMASVVCANQERLIWRHRPEPVICSYCHDHHRGDSLLLEADC